jgi:hypothetical protein
VSRGKGRTPNAVVGLAAARDRLIAAHRSLAERGGDLGALTDVLAVATEIDGMLRALGTELKHARATAAGLSNEVGSLRRGLRSAEDELAVLRGRAALVAGQAAGLELPHGDDGRYRRALDALTEALNRGQEYVLLADRERAVSAVLAVVDGMAWVA